jgi:hypothetical protein
VVVQPDAPAQVSCAGNAKQPGPATAPIPAASGRRPLFQINGLPGAPGPVVRSPQNTYGVPSRAPDTIGNALLSYDTYHYVAASDSSRMFFHLEVGTPREGYCAQQLVYTVLRGVDGMRTQRIMTLTPGPALASHHVVLACGLSSSGSGLSSCAWASTFNGPRPTFGAVWIYPTFRPDGFAEHQMSEAEIVAFVDMVFAAAGG